MDYQIHIKIIDTKKMVKLNHLSKFIRRAATNVVVVRGAIEKFIARK